MKLLKLTRYSEWWEYKLVPLLSVAYATLQVGNYPLDKSMSRLLLIFLAIIVGAVYVSVINDLTDITEDAAAGKDNRIAKIDPRLRIVLVVLCLLGGLFFSYLIYPDRLSLLFYILSWLVFSLYSLPPFRLKKRGIWGLLCDATGAHLFPALLIISSLIYFTDAKINLSWYFFTGLWAFLYGLRGILWHQFYDRKNDIQSGTTTFASRIYPEKFKMQEFVIFSLEIIAFAGMLYNILNLWVLISLILYVVLVFMRRIGFNYKICLIITPDSLPHQLLMNDFYLVFFPLSLLFTAALHQKYGWMILCGHFILFPKKTILVIKDVYLFIKKYK